VHEPAGAAGREKDPIMRHEQILDRDSYRKVSVTAVRPASTLVSPPPIPESDFTAVASDFAPTPAAPDVPTGAWISLAASYLALVGTFALAAAGSPLSVFVIAIAFLFVLTFFAVPRLMFRMAPRIVPASFEAFLAEGMDTLNGRCSGGAALMQMLIVPVLLTFGAVGMAIAAAIYL
jgi:Flp pilus assembly protein TadB